MMVCSHLCWSGMLHFAPVYTPTMLLVNTKKWYRRGTDLWAEFGDEIPFD
jgi:hypothetical protein